jgi:D-glycero-alpha-D-manno-heptose-7-phosphate kinase
MIITRTPFRVSFFGGGTDYPPYYLQNGGAVLSTAINRYCYITCRRFPPFFPNAFRIVWSHIEPVSTVSEILHPAVREGLRMTGYDDTQGVEIHHQGDLPARSGMGSSSAFANGLILALKALKDEKINKDDLYKAAIDLEQNWIKENVGSQDQVATAVGGLNIIHFKQGGEIVVEPLSLASERKQMLKERLMLFYSGASRVASNIAKTFVDTLVDRKAQLKRMHDMVFEARDVLRGGDMDRFGYMLDETWQMKRQLSDMISNEKIDGIYEAARGAGALGGKLLGAGGAGFFLVYADPKHHGAIREALGNLIYVPFDYDDDGATILLKQTEVEPPRR